MCQEATADQHQHYDRGDHHDEPGAPPTAPTGRGNPSRRRHLRYAWREMLRVPVAIRGQPLSAPCREISPLHHRPSIAATTRSGGSQRMGPLSRWSPSPVVRSEGTVVPRVKDSGDSPAVCPSGRHRLRLRSGEVARYSQRDPLAGRGDRRYAHRRRLLHAAFPSFTRIPRNRDKGKEWLFLSRSGPARRECPATGIQPWSGSDRRREGHTRRLLDQRPNPDVHGGEVSTGPVR